MLAWLNLLSSGALVVGMLSGLVIGALSGLVGVLVLLKKRSTACTAISYACLPGIVLAFAVAGVYSHPALLTGAIIVGGLAAAVILFLWKNNSTSGDSSLILVLIACFGLGMVLLTMVQQQPGTAQAGIDSFLFGEAATMLAVDLKVMSALALLVIILLILFWKELLLVAFDAVHAASVGLSVLKLEILFSIILVLTIVAGLQMVGIVLMGAMLVTPAAAARQWTNNIKLMLALAMLFGSVAGVLGSILSGMMPQLPTGPMIVAISGIVAILSFFFAPERGIVWSYLRQERQQNVHNPDTMLHILYLLSCQHELGASDISLSHGHSEKIFQSFFPLKRNLAAVLDQLRTEGLIAETELGYWVITPAGIARMEDYNNG